MLLFQKIVEAVDFMLERIQRKKMEFCTATYVDDYVKTPSNNPRLKIIAEMVGRNKKILDVGCFDGSISSLLMQNCNVVFGMELSKQAISSAKEKGANVVLADVDETFPFSDHYFDVVFAGEIIEHVLDIDYWLQEIARVVKPDGYFVLTTPNLASLGRRFLLFLGRDPLTNQSLFSGAGHVRYFVKQTLAELLEKNNFKIVDFRSDIVNLNDKGNVFSTKLARWFPSMGRGLIVKAVPLKNPEQPQLIAMETENDLLKGEARTA